MHHIVAMRGSGSVCVCGWLIATLSMLVVLAAPQDGDLLRATSPIAASDLVVPAESNVPDGGDPTYRVFRLLTLNASATSLRFSAASLQPQLQPEEGVRSGLVGTSSLASIATNCTKVVLLEDGSGGIAADLNATALVSSAARRRRNLLASLSLTRLVPTTTTQAMLYLVPNRRVYEDFGTGPDGDGQADAVVVRLVVHPLCLVDTSAPGGGGAVQQQYPVNATFRIVPLPRVVSRAQDVFLTAVLGVGMLLTPHAAAHGPRIVMPMVTRRCLAGTAAEAGTPLYQHPTRVDVGGDDADDGLAATMGVVAVEGSIVSGLALLHATGTAVYMWRRHTTLGEAWQDAGLRAMYALRWPSLSVLWTLPFLTQLSMASATLLFSGSGSSLALIGVWGMAWCLIVVLGVLLLLFGCFRAQYVPVWNHAAHAPPPPSDALPPQHPRHRASGTDASRSTQDAVLLRIAAAERELPPEHAPKDTPAVQMLSCIFGKGKWEDDADAVGVQPTSGGGTGSAGLLEDEQPEDAVGAGPFTRSARLLLLEYDGQGSFFIVVDLAMCVVCGALQGVRDSYNGCSALLVAELVVLGLYLGVVVVRRPFRSGYVGWSAGLLTAVMLASCAWELWRSEVPLDYVAYANGDDGERDGVSRGVVNAGIVVLALKVVADGALAGYAYCRCLWSSRSDHGRGEQRRRCTEVALKRQQVVVATPATPSPQLVDEALNALWAAIVALIDGAPQQLQHDSGALGGTTHPEAHDVCNLQEMASSCLELAVTWSSLPSTHTQDDWLQVEQDTLEALSAIETMWCDGDNGCGARVPRPTAWQAESDALLGHCAAVRRSVAQAAHVARACHGEGRRRSSITASDTAAAGAIVPDAAEILLWFEQPKTRRVRPPIPNQNGTQAAGPAPVMVSSEGADFDVLFEGAPKMRREDEEHAMARIESMHTAHDVPEQEVVGTPRFRTSRAIMEHVVDPRANYTIAPRVSREAFLNASRLSSVSRFNPHTHPVSPDRPQFDDV